MPSTQVAVSCLGRATSARPTTTYSAPWPGGKTEFIDALLGSRFMPTRDQAEALAKDLSAQGILDFALTFEKDTIIFFYEMRDMVPSSAVDQVNEIIAEEKAHVSRILKARASIKE